MKSLSLTRNVLLISVILTITVFNYYAPHVSADSSTQAARDFQKTVPRFTGPSQLDENDTNYFINIAILFAIGIIFAIITLLTALFFCICRCCGCCVRPPKPEGYTTKERLKPWIVLVISCLVVIAFCILGLVQNSRLKNTLTGSQSDSMNNLISGLLDSAKAKMDEIKAPLVSINNTAGPTVDSVSSILKNTYQVFATGTSGLLVSLDRLSNTFSNLQTTANCVGCSGTTYTCDYCRNIGSITGNIVTTVNSQATSSLNSINSTLNSVDSSLVSLKSAIQSQMNRVIGVIDDVISQYNSRRKDIRDIQDEVDTRDQQRWIGTLILYLTPIGLFVLIIVASIMKKGTPFKIAVWVTFLVMFIMWILFAIHWPLSAALADSCVRSDVEEAKLAQKNDEPSRFANACLTNQSIITVWNITSEVDFNRISFPTEYNFTDLFNFAPLNSLVSDVNSLTESTFGLNDSVINGYINNLNALLPGPPSPCCFTQQNISTINPANYSSPLNNTVATAKTNILQRMADRVFLNGIIQNLRNNVSAVVNQTNSLRDSAIAAQFNVTQIKNLAQPFIDYGRALVNAANCGFLGSFYRDFKRVTCTDLMNIISLVTLSVFICGLFSIPIIVTSQISASRIPNPLNSLESKVVEVAVMSAEKPLPAVANESDGMVPTLPPASVPLYSPGNNTSSVVPTPVSSDPNAPNEGY